MRAQIEKCDLHELPMKLRTLIHGGEHRLGLLTSIDGRQLLLVFLNIKDSDAKVIRCDLEESSYPSLSAWIPQAHWFERALKDLFGITAIDHPRLKSNYTPEAFATNQAPLRFDRTQPDSQPPRDFHFLHVAGEGVFELPVGPVHAGIIEPGHFRLSCLGEVIQNLEIRLGYLHRGLEQRLSECKWQNARFIVEAAGSDSACANALAHAIALESLLGLEIPDQVQKLRTLALEIERVAMHLSDFGGMAVDLGLLGIAAIASRLRGNALGLADLLSGSRFLRAFVFPGGCGKVPTERQHLLKERASGLAKETSNLTDMFLENASVQHRLSGTGKVSKALAADFGLVGVAARASGIDYDARNHFAHGIYPRVKPAAVLEKSGDALARTIVRAGELAASFAMIRKLLETDIENVKPIAVPDSLPGNGCALSVVESFRGELIHLVLTDASGNVARYAIKDASFNNWTGMAIAARNNLIADFPVCNKSFALSYSGHDL